MPGKIGVKGNIVIVVALRLHALQYDTRVLLLSLVLANQEVGGSWLRRCPIQGQIDRDAFLCLSVFIFNFDGVATQEGLLFAFEELFLQSKCWMGDFLLVLLIWWSHHNRVDLNLVMSAVFFIQLRVKVDYLLFLLDGVVKTVDRVRCIEKTLNCILVDQNLLNLGLLIMIGKQNQKAWHLLVKSSQDQSTLLVQDTHLHLGLALQIEHV